MEPHSESVWEYPRPPRVEDTDRHVMVVFNGVEVANTRRARRVLETSHPPTYYLPPSDVRMDCLQPSTRQTWCEWKGRASHFSLAVGDHESPNAAWTYLDPMPGYEGLTGYVAFYPARVDACFVEGERVRAQPGGFYGGWVTDELLGPFKG